MIHGGSDWLGRLWKALRESLLKTVEECSVAMPVRQSVSVSQQSRIHGQEELCTNNNCTASQASLGGLTT